MLLVHASQVVSSDRLIEELWPGMRPKGFAGRHWPPLPQERVAALAAAGRPDRSPGRTAQAARGTAPGAPFMGWRVRLQRETPDSSPPHRPYRLPHQHLSNGGKGSGLDLNTPPTAPYPSCCPATGQRSALTAGINSAESRQVMPGAIGITQPEPHPGTQTT